MNIQIILFGDVMVGHNVWFRDENNNKIDFVEKLKKIGKVIILKPDYVNFMNLSNNKKLSKMFYKTRIKKYNFKIEDLYFENYSKWVFNQINTNKRYIAIGLDQGCHFAKYFCNMYSENCIGLYILGDRNFTKKSYEKTFHSENNYNFLKSVVGKNYKKYIIENLNNNIIKNILLKIKTKNNNEKYVQLLNGLCKGIIRSQYNKIKKLDVKTFIYTHKETLTDEKIIENNKFNKKSNNKIKYIKISDKNKYLIHGKYKNIIINDIKKLVNIKL